MDLLLPSRACPGRVSVAEGGGAAELLTGSQARVWLCQLCAELGVLGARVGVPRSTRGVLSAVLGQASLFMTCRFAFE